MIDNAIKYRTKIIKPLAVNEALRKSNLKNKGGRQQNWHSPRAPVVDQGLLYNLKTG